MRSNTKPLTMGLKASRGGASSTLRTATRPGSRNNNTKGKAASVSSANGKVMRPGYKQKSPNVSGGPGRIARPGFAQGIGRG